MITPLAPESVWTAFLADIPIWHPPTHKTVIISPHPDDETLGCGGLIAALAAQQAEVIVVAVTDGEAAYPAVDPASKTLAATRTLEQQQALQILGVPPSAIHRFHMPDSHVAPHQNDLTGRLVPVLDTNTTLIAPWHGDFHPDHQACGRAAEAAAHLTGATLVSYFFWTWHRGTPATLAGLALQRFPLSPAQLAAKQQALSCHASQLHHTSGEPILPENLLAPAARPYEVFLPA